MGGHLIQRDGEIYRVSQDCGKRYRQKANINKILQIEGGYKEEKVETLMADFGALGFHTYNQGHDVIVGDIEIVRFVGGILRSTCCLCRRCLCHGEYGINLKTVKNSGGVFENQLI